MLTNLILLVLSVPESIICFLESDDMESAIRLAVSLGGDADTQACIAGSIAGAYYGSAPSNFIGKCKQILPKEFIDIISVFITKTTASIKQFARNHTLTNKS